MISAATVDSTDTLASFSNYGTGPASADLAAPGVNILRTTSTGYSNPSSYEMVSAAVDFERVQNAGPSHSEAAGAARCTSKNF